MIGSMPHKEAKPASALVSRYLKEIPCWCQLPKRSFLENVYLQFSEGMPGVIVSEQDKKIRIDPNKANDADVERLLTASEENDFDKFPVSRSYAEGLYEFLNESSLSSLAVKGQVVGPVSFGLTVMDSGGTPIIYDETLSELAVKLLRLKAGWQEKKLSGLHRNTIIFVDEPYLTSLGSAYVAISKERVKNLLEDVLSGIRGIKGVHCCGNTDWSLLLGASVDILSFDAYNYADTLSLYPDDVGKFLARGGAIAWGIVPNSEEALTKETPSSLKDRLEEALAPFTRKRVRFSELIEHGLLTPCCGLATLSEEATESALSVLDDLSQKIRKAYLRA